VKKILNGIFNDIGVVEAKDNGPNDYGRYQSLITDYSSKFSDYLTK